MRVAAAFLAGNLGGQRAPDAHHFAKGVRDGQAATGSSTGGSLIGPLLPFEGRSPESASGKWACSNGPLTLALARKSEPFKAALQAPILFWRRILRGERAKRQELSAKGLRGEWVRASQNCRGTAQHGQSRILSKER
ncbi:hypothetical protein TRVL_06318 [Trypanosoma vivax]|nr:hypothetical protein TRVL_06318 [Trypanosoma vivax]